MRPALVAATAGVGLFALLFAVTTRQLLAATGGRVIYALDDAYIHMAIAENAARHGVWGINPDAFASASSSPLWTTLLSAFALFGPLDIVPLVLNVLFAVSCIATSAVLLQRQTSSALEIFGGLAAVVLTTPLVPMVWIGMEHTLQILLTLLLSWTTARLVAHGSRAMLAGACVLAALLTATRYEGLFVVAGCAVALAMARRLQPAVAVVGAALVPVVAVGVWNLAHGWFFLPASILMKQATVGGWGVSLVAVSDRSTGGEGAPIVVLAIVTAAMAMLARLVRAGRPHADRVPLVVFVVAAVLHLAFARFGWLYRYEAYLVALGLLAVFDAVLVLRRRFAERSRLPAPAVALFAVAVCMLATPDRTVVSLARVALTSGHIARQHHNVAAFVGRYYDGQSIAANDIGVVSRHTNARVHDLMGLASLDAAMLRRAGKFDEAHVNAWLAHDDVRLAIVYDDWFQGPAAFTRSWTRAGSWTTEPHGEAESRVTFYGRDRATAERLRANLREFAKQLPADIVVSLSGEGAS